MQSSPTSSASEARIELHVTTRPDNTIVLALAAAPRWCFLTIADAIWIMDPSARYLMPINGRDRDTAVAVETRWSSPSTRST